MIAKCGAALHLSTGTGREDLCFVIGKSVATLYQACVSGFFIMTS